MNYMNIYKYAVLIPLDQKGLKKGFFSRLEMVPEPRGVCFKF